MKLSETINPNIKLAKIFGVVLAIIAGVGAINMFVLKTNLFIFKSEIIEAVREEVNPVSYDDLMQILLQMNKNNVVVIDSIYSMANKGYSDLDTLKLKSVIIQYDIKLIQSDLKSIINDISVINSMVGNIQTSSESNKMNDSIRILNKQLIIEQNKLMINEQRINRIMIIQDMKENQNKKIVDPLKHDFDIKRKTFKKPPRK